MRKKKIENSVGPTGLGKVSPIFMVHGGTVLVDGLWNWVSPIEVAETVGLPYGSWIPFVPGEGRGYLHVWPPINGGKLELTDRERLALDWWKQQDEKKEKNYDDTRTSE